MRAFGAALFLIIVLLFSCKDRNIPNSKGLMVGKTRGAVIKSAQDIVTKLPSLQPGFKVSARLLYDDGTLSTFDILNNKTVALWNVVAGGGDALKPSNSTKVVLSGNLDSLVIKIRNGHEMVIDTTIMQPGKDMEYIIKNTGCAEVYITIVKNQKLVYNDTIPFHCGE
jgi:hypothetical protein